MKFLCSLFFLCFIAFANAQPGDQFAEHKATLLKVENALQNDPNNTSLIWERLELTFNPHFNLYSKGQTFEGFRQRGFEYPFYILEDLNYLIAIKASFKVRKTNISLADYYFKRGQFHYVTGYPEYALQDYITALTHNPTLRLKQRICISIAAYYYNLSKNYSLENYEKALSYIDLVTPKEDINIPLTYARYSSRNGDHFQSEKIQLLKASKKTERLVIYLKSIAKSHLYFYKKEREKSEAYQKSHSYTIPYSFQLGLDKLYELALYLYEIGNYDRSKVIIEHVITYIPKNEAGYCNEMYTYGKYFVLLSKIYGTNQYQNSELEIDNLLTALGDSSQGLPTYMTKEFGRLKELLVLYPNAPKLHLAKAIYQWKTMNNGGYVRSNETPLESLIRTEKLGLQDYRIPYLRALLLREEKKYAEALVEITKAELLCVGYVNIYGLKLYLLQNVEILDETAIQETKLLLEASQKQKKVNILSIVEMIHAI